RGEASAWLLDVIGSYQLGPLLIEARGAYSTGNKARDNLSQSKRYYEPLDLDTGYWSGGWLGILGLGVDYFNGGGPTNQGMDTNGGFAWRCGANRAFDLAGYYLSAGPALKLSEVLNGTPVKRDQHDGYYASARVRLSF